MKMRQKLVYALVTSVSLTAGAADWTLISTPEPGVRWYSSESYTLGDGTIRTYLKSEGRNMNRPPFAILIDCKRKRVRDYVAGEFGTEFFKPWQPITPDSAGELAHKAFCSVTPKSEQTSRTKSTTTNQQNLTPAISENYKIRLVARIKVNVDFKGRADSITQGADVEINAATDGTITQHKIVKSSGNREWDEAISRAITKTEILPRDTNGTIPPVFVISLKP